MVHGISKPIVSCVIKGVDMSSFHASSGITRDEMKTWPLETLRAAARQGKGAFEWGMKLLEKKTKVSLVGTLGCGRCETRCILYQLFVLLGKESFLAKEVGIELPEGMDIKAGDLKWVGKRRGCGFGWVGRLFCCRPEVFIRVYGGREEGMKGGRVGGGKFAFPRAQSLINPTRTPSI